MSVVEFNDSTTKTADVPTQIEVKGVKKGAPVTTGPLNGSPLRRAISLTLALCCATSPSGAAAESTKDGDLTTASVGKTRLTSSQITRLFSNVIDRGEVQDQRGVSAETHWYADGTFVSRWWKKARVGEEVKQQVTGRWRSERNLRCVTFSSDNNVDWSCSELWLLEDGRVLSLNPDGSAHGLHRLSTLK